MIIDGNEDEDVKPITVHVDGDDSTIEPGERSDTTPEIQIPDADTYLRIATEERQARLLAEDAAIRNAWEATNSKLGAAEKRTEQLAREIQEEYRIAHLVREQVNTEHEANRLKQEKQQLESGYAARQQAVNWDRHIDAYINQPAHSPRVRTWLTSHYNDLFGRPGDESRIYKLNAAHHSAVAEGHPPESPGYLRAIEERMGYAPSNGQSVALTPDQLEIAESLGVSPEDYARQAAKLGQTGNAAEAQRRHSNTLAENFQGRAAPRPPAAPVSRGGGGRVPEIRGNTSTSITLSPAEVSFCRSTGIDPKAYARSKLSINAGQTHYRWSDVGENSKWGKVVG